MTTSQLPTLDQKRASHAWERITQVKQMKPGDAKLYAGEAKKLPIRIMASGLGQALAFIAAKANDSKPGLTRLLSDLTEWVIVKRPISSAKDPNSLMKSIIAGDSEFLRRATAEALAYLNWLNRFAEAEGLKGDE